MSADNWGNCPKCKNLGEAKIAEAQAKADNAYGRVPAAEWQRMDKEAKGLASIESETLREDYETGIHNGVFSVDYHGSCDRCGFKFSFKYEEQVKVE